ncbi:undecaprenyldiphospho-muramoylpentapeptide beta-N-acetylglucosaminyltransferase [Desulfococcaceae bacterium HSG8]|nr:undecaprenyldiphospho-muramoylpentapeptide beta-N-acetylglucosaminyltransferase [Desulfococcaceae bacterium HSG8]
MKHILIAGGGTGGHLFPGIAIAEAFMAKDPENRVLFVGTGKPFEVSVLSETGFQHESITAEGIKGRGLLNQLRSAFKIPKGIFESFQIIRRFRPDLVLGVGGYSAGPVAIAAWLLGIRIVLHEQNILPGITNRILSRFADRIYVSFPNTKARFNPKKLLVTGNPVRQDIRNPAPDFKLQTSNFNLLILGGSQGAHSINKAVTDALLHLKDRERFFFVHQTGKQDMEAVEQGYREHGVSCKVQSFFNDMARQYHEADMMICRAGATTVAEITAIGKGVIFIPYPFAADNHQVLNARTLADAGAAEMILEKDLDGAMLAERIKYYASAPDRLEAMASRAKSFGRPDAAEVIVEDCYKLLSG